MIQTLEASLGCRCGARHGEHKPFHNRELHERRPIEVIFTARSLYRVLQAHRVQVAGALADEPTLPLRAWRVACGLEHECTDKGERTLGLAHDRLPAEAHLKTAEAVDGLKTTRVRVRPVTPEA